MKNKKIKITYLLISFIFLFTYIGGFLETIKSYAYDNKYIVLSSSSKPSSRSYSTKSKNNINSGSYSSKPNTTTIKPDSGSFSTKPNNNNKGVS